MTELSPSGMQLVHKSTATVTLVVLALAPPQPGAASLVVGPLRCHASGSFFLIKLGFHFSG